MPDTLTVRSNVARDVLATADDFGSVPKMVVEYVSNGLDNPDDPTQPVTVTRASSFGKCPRVLLIRRN